MNIIITTTTTTTTTTTHPNPITHHPKANIPCPCHTPTTTSSTTDTSNLTLTYANLPLLAPKCTPNCTTPQPPSLRLEYRFPPGLFKSKIIQAQLTHRPNRIPRLNLSLLRSVPDTAPCVEFALRGDIEGLKSLFGRGLASPGDVSVTRGYTLVRLWRYGTTAN
ncbi:hypothetical protein BDV25DRAFT_145692 [Aspergillus avenaceus]|uniref:Uncharacterized protein n=1 Tax=Aspergillus avenaceus TaxID=36643 RepID=A0A5N6TDA9_ASPAV|nr:hypothetical protein BDV25DRAFT_145692 [Aspergillus avenaceus]